MVGKIDSLLEFPSVSICLLALFLPVIYACLKKRGEGHLKERKKENTFMGRKEEEEKK